jgi:hypothetical protein
MKILSFSLLAVFVFCGLYALVNSNHSKNNSEPENQEQYNSDLAVTNNYHNDKKHHLNNTISVPTLVNNATVSKPVSNEPATTKSNNDNDGGMIDYNLRIFEGTFHEMSTKYINDKSNLTDYRALKYLAINYEYSMKSLMNDMKTYYNEHKDGLSKAQKDNLDWTYHLCDVQVQQAKIDMPN